MSVLAIIGLINVMLASVVVLLLPACLAIWVSAAWAWLYLAYAFIAFMCVCLIVGTSGRNNEDNDDAKG